MDLASILLIGCVLFFTVRGFQAGFIKACGRILALIAGYGASLLFTAELVQWLNEQLAAAASVSPLVIMLASAMGLFITASLLMSALIHLLLKLLPSQLPESWPLKFGGAGVGAAAGFIVSVILMWFVSLFQGVNQDGQPPEQASATNSLASQVMNKTTIAVAKRVSAQMDSEDMIAQAVATLMLQPGDTIASLKRLSRSEDLQSLLNSENNQRALMRGDTRAIQQLPDYRRLLNNPDMRRVFDPSDTSDAQLANTFATLWQRSQAMQHDPEIQQLLRDPELRQQLDSGNPAALLTNPKTAKLFKALLTNPEKTPDPFIAGTQSMSDDFDITHTEQTSRSINQQPATKKPASRDYVRWTDEQGRVHFGDAPRQ